MVADKNSIDSVDGISDPAGLSGRAIRCKRTHRSYIHALIVRLAIDDALNQDLVAFEVCGLCPRNRRLEIGKFEKKISECLAPSGVQFIVSNLVGNVSSHGFQCMTERPYSGRTALETADRFH